MVLRTAGAFPGNELDGNPRVLLHFPQASKTRHAQ